MSDSSRAGAAPYATRRMLRSGDDVRYVGIGGYAKDRARAREELTVGSVYRVDGVFAGGFYTSISLYGAKGRFNSVLFEIVPPEEAKAA